MSRSVHVLASDTNAGRLLAREGDDWYLLSAERGWIPLQISDGGELIALFLHGDMRPVEKTFRSWDLAKNALRRAWKESLPRESAARSDAFSDCPREDLLEVTCQRVEDVVAGWWRALDDEAPLTESEREDYDRPIEVLPGLLELFEERADEDDRHAAAIIHRFNSLAHAAGSDGLLRRSKSAGTQIREFVVALDAPGWEAARLALARLASRLLGGGRSSDGGSETQDPSSAVREEADGVLSKAERQLETT